MKPICRITIKDLLDQMDQQESGEKAHSSLFTPDQLVCSLISIEETAYLLDIDPQSLAQELQEPGNARDVHPVSFFRDLDVRL